MWYFTAPQIVFGEGALDALDELEGRRALIVTDAALVKLGVVGQVQARLAGAGFEVGVFDAVEADPSLSTARLGAQQARAFEPDWIIGLGGGSAMDAAKAIWVLYERPELQPEEINPFLRLGLRSRWGRPAKARLATIPTTSGTGAEATWAIVLSDPAERRKMGLGNRENIADLAIIDPALAAGMPPRLTADTGLDALTHAVEGYTCSWHTDLTDGLCLNAVRLILEYLPRAVADGADREAREKMHNAAACAGLGFGNAMASMAHAMGHVLGAVFHLHHGRAVALCLPYTIEFAARCAPQRFADLAAIVGLPRSDDEQAARALARQIGNPISLAEAGVPREAFEAELVKLVNDAFNDTQMVTAAREPSFDELERLFRCAYEGRGVDF